MKQRPAQHQTVDRESKQLDVDDMNHLAAKKKARVDRK